MFPSMMFGFRICCEGEKRWFEGERGWCEGERGWLEGGRAWLEGGKTQEEMPRGGPGEGLGCIFVSKNGESCREV